MLKMFWKYNSTDCFVISPVIRFRIKTKYVNLRKKMTKKTCPNMYLFCENIILF